VRQNLYTCCRCGEEQRTPVEQDDVPIGWATLAFQRDLVETHRAGGDRLLKRQYLTTHTCPDCCDEALAFLEKATRPDVDREFDDGGDA
jgi:hypothetical protein